MFEPVVKMKLNHYANATKLDTLRIVLNIFVLLNPTHNTCNVVFEVPHEQYYSLPYHQQMWVSFDCFKIKR